MRPTGAENHRLDPETLRTLSRRSDCAAWVQLGGHIAALMTSGGLVLAARGTPWLVPAMGLHGVILVFLFAPLHETIHRTAFRNRRLNDAVAFLCGLPLVLSPSWFRAFHFAHHRHTQDPERDPELASPKPATFRAWLIHISGLPTWWSEIRTLIRLARGRADDTFVAARDMSTIVAEAQSYLLLYTGLAVVALAAGSLLPLLLWIGPALLGQPILRLYLLAEHTGCPFLPDMLKNTRTTLTNRVLRRLAWNMPFHAEHHAYPSIPFHALPRAHERLRPELEVIGDGYVAVNREILAHLGSAPTVAAAPTHQRS